MTSATLNLPLYEAGVTYKQKFIWSSLLKLLEVSIEGFEIKCVTGVPHELTSSSLVSLQDLIPAFYNTSAKPVTVLSSNVFTISPDLPIPDYILPIPQFGDTSCRVPFDLTSCQALFTIYDNFKQVVVQYTHVNEITLEGLTGVIEILISDEETALLPRPTSKAVEERFSYILDITFPSGEVFRVASGFFLPNCAKQSPSINIVRDTTYIVTASPQGARGAPGLAASTGILSIEYTATADGSQTIPITGISSLLWADVYINGLLQARSSYSTASLMAELPPTLDIRQDDFILILYQ